MKETKFKQTEVGMIPSDWEVKTLGELYKVHNGLSKGKQFFGHGYPFLSFSVVFNNVFIPNKLENLVDSSKEERASYSINKGDVFITRTSETVDELGMSCVALKDYPNATYNGFCKRLRPNDVEFVNLGYLGFYLRSDFIREWFLKFSTVTTRASLKNDELLSLPLVLPPTIEEQQRIANVLSDVDTLINNLEKLIAKKKNIKQGAMQQLLTGKQRLSGFDGVWEYDKLGNIAEMNSGGTPSSENSHYYGGKIPFLSISDMTKSGKYIFVTEKSITQLGLDNSSARVYPAGTLLYAMYASLGKCSISKIDLAISQAILGFKLSNLIDRDFMYYYFCFIENTIKNIGQTGTQSNLSKSIVENFEIYHPHDVSEQQAIAKILSDMDTEIATLETKLAKYRKLKTGMMQQLLTGKIRLIKAETIQK